MFQQYCYKRIFPVFTRKQTVDLGF